MQSPWHVLWKGCTETQQEALGIGRDWTVLTLASTLQKFAKADNIYIPGLYISIVLLSNCHLQTHCVSSTILPSSSLGLE